MTTKDSPSPLSNLYHMLGFSNDRFDDTWTVVKYFVERLQCFKMFT